MRTELLGFATAFRSAALLRPRRGQPMAWGQKLPESVRIRDDLCPFFLRPSVLLRQGLLATVARLRCVSVVVAEIKRARSISRYGPDAVNLKRSTSEE